jgi:hypothetical protein
MSDECFSQPEDQGVRQEWRGIVVAAGVLIFTGASIAPAAARQCHWDGSSPFCEGRCARGYQTVATKACFSGFKVKCCERLKSVSMGQKRRR